MVRPQVHCDTPVVGGDDIVDWVEPEAMRCHRVAVGSLARPRDHHIVEAFRPGRVRDVRVGGRVRGAIAGADVFPAVAQDEAGHRWRRPAGEATDLVAVRHGVEIADEDGRKERSVIGSSPLIDPCGDLVELTRTQHTLIKAV